MKRVLVVSSTSWVFAGEKSCVSEWVSGGRVILAARVVNRVLIVVNSSSKLIRGGVFGGGHVVLKSREI